MPGPLGSETRTPLLCDRQPLAAGLASFYKTARGKALAADTLAFVRDAWGKSRPSNLHFMCFGFPPPGLKDFVKRARSFALLTPSVVGPLPWPARGVNQSAMVDEARLALRAGCFDRVLVFHALEHLADPVSFLEEIWLVSAPGGRAIFLVPKGRGLLSPSGFKTFLAGKGFMPAAQAGALFGLPGNDRHKPMLSGLLKALNPKFGHMGAAYCLVEAGKRQDNFGARNLRAVKAAHARPIPS